MPTARDNAINGIVSVLDQFICVFDNPHPYKEAISSERKFTNRWS
jgi:hypothetical protein